MRLTENIIQNIRDRLGSNYYIFDSNSREDIELSLKERDKVVGVAYNTYGDYKALNDTTALECGILIDFSLPISVYDERIREIEEMSQEMNAQYQQVVYDDEGEVQGVFNYVLVFDIDRASSSIYPNLYNFRQTVSVAIKVTASPDLAFGNSRKLEINYNSQWLPLKNIIDLSFVGAEGNTPRTDLNNYSITYEQQYSEKKVVVTYLYKENDILHSLFEGHRINGVSAKYQLRYTQNDKSIIFSGFIGSYQHQFPMGGFQSVVCDFLPCEEETNETQNYTLTVLPNWDCNISVTRYGINLQSGAVINSGDVITVTALPTFGYTLTSLKVNNEDISNGSEYVVNGNTVIVATVTSESVATYTLSISQGSNTTVTVIREGHLLYDGAILQDRDILTVTAVGNSGYDLTTFTINGESGTSGETIIVNGNVDIETLGSIKTFTIGVTKGVPFGVPSSYGEVKVYRITNGANEIIVDTSANHNTGVVNYGDILKYAYTISTNNLSVPYLEKSVFTVNGVEIANNSEGVVHSNINIVANFNRKTFLLTITKTSGIDVTVLRGYETLESGSVIYVGDIITVTPSIESLSGYTVTNTLNGVELSNLIMPYTVTGNVNIMAKITATIMYYDYNNNYLMKETKEYVPPYGATFTIKQGIDSNFLRWQVTAASTSFQPNDTYIGGNMILRAIAIGG